MKINKFAKLFLLSVSVLFPLAAKADGDLIDWNAGLTISVIGVGTGATGAAYLDLAEFPASAKGCTWGFYYIELGTPAGVATYATLLNAYNRGKKLRRLHFFQSSSSTVNTVCSVNLIELKN